MNSHTGAERPVLKRKILWIAITAIILVLAWARAGFPYPEISNPYFYMGTDGGVEGMMPPVGGARPTTPPNNGNGNTNMQRHAAPTPTPNAKRRVLPSRGGEDLVSRDVTITQSSHGRTFTYVASPNGTVYLIKRDGTPWVTLTYNKSTGYYELTDPNGAGDLLLRLGPKRPGPGAENR